jgi:phage shock protein A
VNRYGPTPTVNSVVHRLVELAELLDKATSDIAILDERAVRAKCAHEVAFARAFLQAEGAMDVRKQIAVRDTTTERFAAESAEQLVRACRERIRTIRDQIEIGRSLNSAVKAEWTAGAIGQP